jgi:regulatory protein
MTVGTDVTDGGDPRSASEPGEGLAPVIPLFGARPGAEPDAESEAPRTAVWRSTWDEDVVPLARRSAGGDDNRGDGRTDGAAEGDGAVGPSLELAEKQLLKKLRVRSLSISEARSVLLGFGTPAADADLVIDAFVSRGYLDDAALAEQLVHVGLDRKGQGRRVIAQSLAKRGVPRDIADAALRALPDDDAERALDFARGKARSLASLDRETALRRLTGQLARRGYGGSVALDAARAALDEAGG